MPDLDEVAVQRAIAGDHSVRLTTPEQIEAVRRMASTGRTDTEVAHALGITRRTVLRIRSRHGIPSAVDHATTHTHRRGTTMTKLGKDSA